MKKVVLNLSECHALGDTICATPTIRKLYEAYQQKIIVQSNFWDVFENNKCVDYCLGIKSVLPDYGNVILHNSFKNIGKKNEDGVEQKHNRMDIRQFHAVSLGFQLTKDELQCEFTPNKNKLNSSVFENPYVVIHPVSTWASRTWDSEKWMQLTKLLNDSGISVVSIGKDSSETGFFNMQKPCFNFTIQNGFNFINATDLSDCWHLINNAICFVTMDSGLLHLAGTTDGEILQLGSSILPEFRIPYRFGDQSYKYRYVVGNCRIHCASNMKYGVKEWGDIQGVPPLVGCLEYKSKFECHPTVAQVFATIQEINNK